MSKRKANDSEYIDHGSFLDRFYNTNSQADTKLGAKKSSALKLHDTAASIAAPRMPKNWLH